MAAGQRKIDEMDRKLMRELVRDSSRSYRELAKAVGLSPASVVDRVKTLERTGYITGYGARLNYPGLGFEYMAIVEISITGKKLLEVEESISRIPHVAAVWDCTGEYDALAVVMCKTRGELSVTVKRILGTENVVRTNTNVVLNVISRLTEYEGV